jgi:hypothetical protein
MRKKETDMKRLIISFMMVAIVAFLWSCGGDSAPSTGTVALFATDDIAGFEQVAAVINGVSLLHTGSGESCDVLNEPTGMDVAELSDEILLMDVSDCTARSYNRIRIVFKKSVTLTDATGTQTCDFVSYKNDAGQPNVLNCAADGTCTMDVNGTVNVFANQNEKLALDFMLKDFEVTGFPNPGCQVTMKVSPLNASGMMGKVQQGYHEAVSGTISNLDVTAKTFVLKKGSTQFVVDYSAVTQEGIDELLQFAQEKSLRARVTATSIDSGSVVAASGIFVKVEGTVADLVDTTFTLEFRLSDSITVDYSGAVVEEASPLADGASVDVNLSGVSGTTYTASKVEVGEEPVMN